MHQYATWFGGRLSPGNFVLDGDRASPPQEEFSAHVYCGKTAAWIKMPLGTEVGLGPDHIVLDGDPAPLPKRGRSRPQFSAHVNCGQTAGWIQMALGMLLGLCPGHIRLDGIQFPSLEGAQPPNFRPMSVVAKRLDGLRCHLVWR